MTSRTPLMTLVTVLLVLGASGAVLADAPPAVSAPSTLLALAVVAERLARTRRRGLIDKILLACGGSLVTLILLGFFLGLTGIGLSSRTWALALGVVSLLGLGVAEYAVRRTSTGEQAAVRSAAPMEGQWTPRLRNLPWAVAVVAVFCVALTISVRATQEADVSPLQMAFGVVQDDSAQVVVSSDENSGDLELRTEAEDGTTLSYPLFSVGPGRPRTESVALPSTGRFVITLNNPDQSNPLRSLILDR